MVVRAGFTLARTITRSRTPSGSGSGSGSGVRRDQPVRVPADRDAYALANDVGQRADDVIEPVAHDDLDTAQVSRGFCRLKDAEGLFGFPQRDVVRVASSSSARSRTFGDI